MSVSQAYSAPEGLSKQKPLPSLLSLFSLLTNWGFCVAQGTPSTLKKSGGWRERRDEAFELTLLQ